MKIFLSWSGGLSHEVAKALNSWLPQVMNAVQPWLSSQDIEKGSRWFEEIGETLSKTNFGVLCLTQTNIAAPWILFEAGALSKSLGQARVCPLLINIKNADLQGPLAQFNTAGTSREEILQLIQSINEYLPEDKRRTQGQLEEAFDVWWPRLENKLEEAVRRSATDEAAQPKAPKRKSEDILDEILELTRQTAHELRPPAQEYWRMLESVAGQQPRMRATKYPANTVGYFAAELSQKTEALIEQLASAGVEKAGPYDPITEEEKGKLLKYLQSSHGSTFGEGRKLTLTRKTRRI